MYQNILDISSHEHKKIIPKNTFDPYNAQRIGITNIWIGPIESAIDLVFLIKNDIKYVINLSGMTIHQSPHIFYHNIFISDRSDKEISVYFKECHEIIDHAIKNDENILINCYAGISRSASICLSWLMKELDIKYIDAIELLRIYRPITRPNDGFVKQLTKYEKISHDLYTSKRGF